jgi:hypothetical protein
MANLTEKLKTALETSGIKAYPLTKPQDATLPCCTYQRISTDTLKVMSGQSTFNTSRFQVDVWASNYKAAVEQAITIIGILDGNSTNFEVSQLGSYMETIEAENNLYRCTLDFMLQDGSL